MHRDDPKVEPGPMVEILNEYHKAGRIGAFGGSNWTHQRIAEANQYAGEHGLIPFTVCEARTSDSVIRSEILGAAARDV